VLDRLDHAQGHTDEVAQKKAGQAERDGNRKPGLDDVPHGVLIHVGIAQVQVSQVPQPERIPDVNRLIEAVVLPDLLDRFGGQFDARASSATRRSALRHRPHPEAHDLALDRAAGHEMHHDEDHEGDAEECRDDQQRSTEKIGRHLTIDPTECSDTACSRLA
jgi:hypothetical protein